MVHSNLIQKFGIVCVGKNLKLQCQWDFLIQPTWAPDKQAKLDFLKIGLREISDSALTNTARSRIFQIFPRNDFCQQHYFSLLIRGPDGVESGLAH